MTHYSYLLPNKKTIIVFSHNVLTHMFSFAQDKPHLPEAGGQLFSRTPDESTIVIDEITGPYLTDKQTRHSWIPDASNMSSDREKLFAQNIYVVGLWHTHPERIPRPSRKDKVTCEKHLHLLDPAYKGFLLITLGNGHPIPAISIEYLERDNYKWHSL